MRPRNRAVDAGERELWFSLRHHMGHDLVPYAANGSAAKAQIGVMPVAQFSGHRAPFGPVVEPPEKASIVRRSSVRGRAPRIFTTAIAASNFAHWASVSTYIVSPFRCPMKPKR